MARANQGRTQRSRRARHLLVILPTLVIVAVLVLLAHISLDSMSATRGYVGGESLWSKAQKDAVFRLYRYAESQDEADYRQFRDLLAVPHGDRIGRLELEKAEPDLDVVRAGYLAGGIHPDDADSMIVLFRRFRGLPDVDRAIDLWAEGDRQIARIEVVAERLHEGISRQSMSAPERTAALAEIAAINAELTTLELEFAAIFGKISRMTHSALRIAFVVVALLLGLAAAWISRRVLHHTARAEDALRASEERFSLAVAGSNDGIWDWNLIDNTVYYSPRFKQLVGFAEDNDGYGFDAYIANLHPDDVERVRAAFRRHIAEDAPYDLEYRLRTPSGDHRWLHARGKAVRNERGEPVRMAGSVTDITDRREIEMQLVHQASHDELTGLFNRREFERRLQARLADCDVGDAGCALLYMDLDQFKVINDTGGHAAGDELMRQIGVSLKRRLRADDTLARLGGDEFGVLIVGCHSEGQALHRAEELRQAIADFRFIWQTRPFALTASIGLVMFGDTPTSSDALLVAADAACYLAKDQGRNRVHVYHPSSDDIAHRRDDMEWIRRLREALAEGRFRLYAQDIVPIHAPDQRGRHVELLLRLVDETGQIVLPMSFIPAAERYGLMPTIDRWVVSAAFALHARMAATNPSGTPETCTINLSGLTFGEQHLPEFLIEQFARHGVPYHAICFEITETAAIANLARASRFIERMKGLGCRFSLDDFGAGTSSFAYLKQLPVDYLKIDGAFVRDMLDDPVDGAIVEAIHRVGQLMGMRTIAEFVESHEILARLREIGVDHAQGYAIAAPTPWVVGALPTPPA